MCGPLNPNAGIKAIDFAGGTVVHMSSGWTALVLCLILGPRMGFGKEPMPPHSMVLCMVGTGMLYVGWFGFNAGSALGADAIASNAFTTTMLAAATGGFVWAVMEWFTKGHPSVLGFCSGIVAGLVVVTPACGFVTPGGAMVIGVAAGIIPFLAVTYLKKAIGYDDALDTFGVHGVGGTLGALLTGLLASERPTPSSPGSRRDFSSISARRSFSRLSSPLSLPPSSLSSSRLPLGCVRTLNRRLKGSISVITGRKAISSAKSR